MNAATKKRLKNYGRRAFFIGLYAAAAVVVWNATVGAGRDGRRAAPAATAAHELTCELPKTGSALHPLAYLPEASGLALSRRSPGMLWSLDDSDQPTLIAVDADGSTRARVMMPDAVVTDWEDISVGSCRGGSCLYVADVGDNAKDRSQVTIYRLPEPATSGDTSVKPDALQFQYPDRPHDAEAAFIGPDQALYVVTKGHPTTLYRAPADARAGETTKLARVAELPLEQFFADRDRKETRITDAETTPDGMWVALRTNSELLVFPARELVSGNTSHPWHVDLRALNEPQGEGVAISNAGDVYLSGEGGKKGVPGTLAHLKCTLPDSTPR